MILLCYDGSPDAQHAIAEVGGLMPRAETVVLTVWEPFLSMMARNGAFGMGMGGAYVDVDPGDDAAFRAASETASAGASHATEAGLAARPRVATLEGNVARTVAAIAAELDADLIVVGTRGLGGVKSLLMGSVSHDVVQHADRAVLVVPSPAVVERRTERVADAAASA